MNTRKVFISATAQRDILQAVAYIRNDKPQAAEKFKQNMLAKIDSLRIFSSRGRRVPELAGSALSHYRELLVGNYRVLYKIGTDAIRILRVTHGKRRRRF